jgi:hypothetical protein
VLVKIEIEAFSKSSHKKPTLTKAAELTLTTAEKQFGPQGCVLLLTFALTRLEQALVRILLVF